MLTFLQIFFRFLGFSNDEVDNSSCFQPGNCAVNSSVSCLTLVSIIFVVLESFEDLNNFSASCEEFVVQKRCGMKQWDHDTKMKLTFNLRT